MVQAARSATPRPADGAPPSAGREMHELMARLYPICRSLTGRGQRETLAILREFIDLTVHEIASGTQVFDWSIPREWNIRGAYIKDPAGKKIVDFAECNLHVLNYSAPVRRSVSLEELKKHLYTLPEHPDWIPYRTSYYQENWGFCLSHRQYLALAPGDYEVCIDSTLENGSLTYGEYYVAGEEEEEVLISCHICHPSLANDNLSGIAVATFLARHLTELAGDLTSAMPRYSYRFLFTPGQIGSIAWLFRNQHRTSRIHAGLILTNLGDPGAFTYKKSRRGNAEIDRAAGKALRDRGAPHDILDFVPFGYDERQFCSPGFNLPVGCFMRTPYGRFPEYHTSADNLSFVRPEKLDESLRACWDIIQVLENNRTWLNTHPKCEPQLGKRGLYGSVGGGADDRSRELALLWVLNGSDGHQSLLDIAERSGLPFTVIADAARQLARHQLLAEKV